MSYPLIHRGRPIVLTMDDGSLRYHISSPFTTGYESLDEVRRAIDALIDR